MSEEFDPSDYSFVVKRRGSPAKPWRWEIYRAGRSGPVESSPVFFESMAKAIKEGKKASHTFWLQRQRDSYLRVPGPAITTVPGHFGPVPLSRTLAQAASGTPYILAKPQTQKV